MTERKLDLRYKNGVDKGAMSSLNIPFPVKGTLKVVEEVPEKPKQYLRAELAQKQNRKNPRTLSMYRCKPKPKK
jgi:hypothetical protein